MKKTILFIAFITVSITAFSQVKVRPGVRLGLNAATFTNIENTSRKIGVNAAMYANVHLSRFYELQPELTYSSQGVKLDDYNYYEPFTGTNVTVKGEDYTVNYLGLAITNKFFIVPNTGLHLIIGPSLEVNISDDFDDDDDVTPIDFSLFGGIGYEFPFGLGIEARYKQGLIDVRDNYNDYYDYDDDDDYYDGDNVLNGVIQFGVYYKFGF